MKPVKGKEIREAFLSYFEKQGHARVASSKLVPENDPTLLFTSAGMVQFKDTFLGLEKRPYTRATSSQKCVRAGGKHNDLENVGFTERHHTFFEMLGNFSFGDYFKKDAIHFAWEFVTKDLGLPKDRLRVSVFETDDEAADIWHKQEGVPLDRIVRFGEKDNFWAAGETGPCGPCSEIFWDQGKEVDGDRWLEFWNLVFMQYERGADGKLNPLKNPSIDTGMGLERMATVMQGVESNYDIDLFTTLIKETHTYFENKLKHKIDMNVRDNVCATRVIVDHLRSTSFLIADGVMPSNEGRGYVLRRILRRAVRFGHKLGMRDPFLEKIYPALEASLADIYPELTQRKSYIVDVLKQEEAKFFETLDRGIELLDDAMKKGEKALAPDTVFKLYDTFGFPFDLTQLIATERGVKIEMDKVDALLTKQQEMSRASWKGSGSEAMPNSVKEWQSTLKTTPKFYELDKCEAQVLAIDASEGGAWVAIDPCPFYAESGGQVADTGKLVDKSGKTFKVVGCKKVADGLLAIRIDGTCTLKKGDSVSAEVDNARRTKIRSNHTATHLLHASLRKYLGTHVHQAGSFLDDSRLRFDFSHNKSVSDEEKQNIENWVNEQINGAHNVKIATMSHKEAVAQGAMALFGEKYGDTVRVVNIEGTPSMELCGGLHVANTRDIKKFKLIKESGVSSGVRRVEAVSGAALEDYYQSEIVNVLSDIEKLQNELTKLNLKFSFDLSNQSNSEEKLFDLLKQKAEAEEKISSHKKELKKQEDEAFRANFMSKATDTAEDFVIKGENLKLLAFEDEIAIDKLRELVDQARSKAGSDKVAFLAVSKLGFFVSKTNESQLSVADFRQSLVSEQNFKGGGDNIKAQGKVPADLNLPKFKEWLKSKANA